MKTMKSMQAVAGALALCAAGCASNVQYVPIPNLQGRVDDPSKGRVYMIRPSGMGAAASLEVWDGTVHIGNTGSKAYLCWERPPGEALISGKEENTSTVSLWVKTNEVYYIFQHMRMGWWQARNELEVISAEQGAELLKKCKGPQPGKCEDHTECKTGTAARVRN
jgi:hypothetical protein